MDLFGDKDLWKILLHVEDLLGFSAFPPMTKGQCQVLQASLGFALDFEELGETGERSRKWYQYCWDLSSPGMSDKPKYSQLKVYTLRQLSHL